MKNVISKSTSQTTPMTDRIQVKRDVGVPEMTANLVPMLIRHSGCANSDEYFTPSKSIQQYAGQEVDVAYFRGCRLVGTKASYDDYEGYVMTPSESLEQSDDGSNITTAKTYTPVAKFDGIHVFGHDSPAEVANQWALVNEWKLISDIIHSD